MAEGTGLEPPTINHNVHAYRSWIVELLQFHPDAPSQARSFVESPATVDQVLGLLERDADESKSFADMYDYPEHLRRTGETETYMPIGATVRAASA